MGTNMKLISMADKIYQKHIDFVIANLKEYPDLILAQTRDEAIDKIVENPDETWVLYEVDNVVTAAAFRYCDNVYILEVTDEISDLIYFKKHNS